MEQEKRVFITVKTYPHPSSTYGELVCTAGIDEHGNFIRLYPLPFRSLDTDQIFRKYQWITIPVQKNSSDPRPESFKAAASKLQTGDWVKDWSEREKLIISNRKLLTMCQLNNEAGRLNRSLAIVKPKIVTNFFAEPDSSDWSPEQQESMRQLSLLDGVVTRLKPIKKYT